LKSQNKDAGALMSGVKYLVSARSGSGAFGSTQGTILALKALTEYAKFSKKMNEDGTIQFFVDGKKVSERSYKAGDNGAMVMEGVEDHIRSGKHDLKVKFTGCKNPLPYSLAVNWNTFLPNSDKEC